MESGSPVAGGTGEAENEAPEEEEDDDEPAAAYGEENRKGFGGEAV